MVYEIIPVWIWMLLIPLIIWETIWKGFGLWHSARNKHTVWFICILIINTAGILPIIYLLINKNKSKIVTKKKK